MLFICKDAEENSIIANLFFAIKAKQSQNQVSVLFTQDALAALAGQSFDWAPILRDRTTRTKIARKAKTMGMPICPAPTPGFPAVDTPKLLKMAKDSGVSLFACPMWMDLLELRGELPSEVEPIDFASALGLLTKSGPVIGCL